jgi:hypothetical protein
MCTFENCAQSEKLYVTRHDWIFYETQMHRRQWFCSCCSQNFETCATIRQHMHDQHGGQVTEKQLPALLDLCERAIDGSMPTDCPLYEQTLPLTSVSGREGLQGNWLGIWSKLPSSLLEEKIWMLMLT